MGRGGGGGGGGGGGASKNTRSFEGEGFDSILTIIVGEG